MRILHIDYNSSQAQSASAGLQQRGHSVETADSLQRALEQLKSGSFDVLLMELSLVDSSGIETLQRVKEQCPDVPIVVFTAIDDASLAVDTIGGGAEDYLVKGTVSEDALFQRLQFAVERHRKGAAQRRGWQNLKNILENSYDAFLSMDSSWHITDWNIQAEHIFGFSKEQALGQSASLIIPQHLRKQYMSSIQASLGHPTDNNIVRASEEIFALHHDGHEFPIEIVVFRVKEAQDYTLCALVRDLTERKRSSQQLERLVQERTEKLMRSNDELRQFARIASHDLQEPLRAVQGFATLLADNTKTSMDGTSAEFIEHILAGTERMQHLVKSILKHSQITSDNAEHQVTSCNSVIEEVLSDLGSLIKNTGTRLEVGRLPAVAVERSQVIQLFQNLIGNAIKYRSCNEPFIHISAEANHNNWLFSVRDNGIGIEPQYADKIFDMFARLHGKLAYPGTGMGLAICKKVVTSHGGTIWVESKPGEGCIFLFTLPAAKKPRRTKMKDSIKILLVEDTPSDVRLTEEALKRTDLAYELAVTNDGVEAMEYLHQMKDAAAMTLPDIILLDLNMPRKNGHEVLHDIKNDPQLKAIPVVLLTVSEDDADVEEALRLRMNYYIAKPVSPERLYVLIKAIRELHATDSESQSPHSNEEMHVRQVLAGNPHTAQVALGRLACDASENIRSRVAANPNVALVVLQKLAADESAEVRLSVGENPCVPVELLKRLVHDSNADVRLGLSGNRHMPLDLLQQLSSDENVHVAQSAVTTIAALQQVV